MSNLMITDHMDLADYFDIFPRVCKGGRLYTKRVPADQWEQRISSKVCKLTSCGAWLKFISDEQGVGIKIGSIVEGTEQEAESITLRFPFTVALLMYSIGDIEHQCHEIWMATHGCERCEFDGWDDPETGYIRVNPNCPECKGEGIVI